MSHLIDWESVCLVCLQKCENRSIFEQDNDSNLIADKIMKCADILIKKSTNQPENICLQCLEALNIAYKFRQNCEQSDSIIKALLNANHKEFEVKNLWKTTSITMNPDVCIKDEIVDKPEVDDVCDEESASCLGMEDDHDTESTVVENNTDDCVHDSDEKLNDEATESNETKQETNNEISRRPKGRPKKSAKASYENQNPKSGYKRPLKICKICNNSFSGQNGLDTHMRRHNNERPFNCDHCNKSFVTVSDLQRHVRGYTGQRPFKCQFCDRGFVDSHARKNHERIHTDERPYVCPTCGKSFRISSVLIEHLRIHTGEKKFVCKECGRGFARKVLFQKHAARHLTREKLGKSSEHEQKKREAKEISQVEKTENSNEVNIKHETIDHAVIEDPDTGIKFVDKERAGACVQNNVTEINNAKPNESNKIKQEASDEISRRLTGHSNAIPEVSCDKPSLKSTYKRPLKICELCNRSCRGQRELDIHMRRHNDERPFSCSHCDKAFVIATDLRRHERVHTGEKPFKCQYCDRRFSDHSHRKNHERTHTGERPFVCPTCGKSFAYSNYLTEHRRIHTGVKKFVCKECGRGFVKKGVLERHVARHHTQNKLDKLSEPKEKKMLVKEIFKIEECANSNEINIKHEVKLIEEEIC